MRKRIANVAALLGALALAGTLLAGAAALLDGARTAHAQESGGEQQAGAEGQAEDGGVRGQDDVDLFCADGGTTRSVLAGSIQTVSCEVSNDTGYNIRLSVSRTGGVQEVSRSLGSRRSNGTRPVTVRVRVNSAGSVTIRAEDHQDWDEDTIDFTITDSMPTFGTVTISNKSWTHNKAISSFRLPAATGGDGTLMYSISPALPSGVRRSNFTVSGTPNALKTNTAYTWTATDADGDTATRSFNIEVLPQVTISRGTSPITEGTDATFTLTASPAPLSNLSVRVSVTQSGAFISGTPPTTVQISSGRTTGRLTVQTRNDSVDEPHGSITARVLDGTGYVVGTTFSAKVTVEDNEPDPTAEPDLKPSFSATISNKSWTHNEKITEFRLPAATDGDGTLSYSLSPALPSGVRRSNFTVRGTPNALKASTAYTWTATDADGDTATRSFNIEVLPQVSIAAGTSPIAEGTTAQFTLTASAAPPSAIEVNVWVTQSGTFISGTPPKSVTIPANETTATLSVPTLKDKVNEADGYVRASVRAGTNYAVGSTLPVSVSVRDTPYVSIAAGTSPITEGANATFTITAAGAPVSRLSVQVSVTESRTGGETYIKGTAPSSVTIPASSAHQSTATLTVATENDATDEPNGSITASIVANAGAAYELGSPSNASVNVQDNDLPKLAAPTGLAITPLPGGTERKARLNWGTVSGRKEYQVEVRQRVSGGSWQAAHTETITDTAYEIKLDSILSNGQGLADASAYWFRVKAVGDGVAYESSEFSGNVELRDTYITSVNGDSSGRTDGKGQAVVAWRHVPGVTAYRLRWRKMADYQLPRRLRVPASPHAVGHPDIRWRPQAAEGNDWTEVTLSVNRAKNEHTVENLELGAVYAFQLNYDHLYGSSSGRSVTEKGFAAREAYAWPAKGFSSNFPLLGRVATYPFAGHFSTKEYRYRVCEEGFYPNDVSRQAAWMTLLDEAFAEWNRAQSMIEAIKEDKACTDLSLIRNVLHRIVSHSNLRAEDDSRSEIRMIDDSGWSGFLSTISFTEMLTDPFKICIFGGNACVTSFSAYTEGNRPSYRLNSMDITFKKTPFDDDDSGNTLTDGKNPNYPRIPTRIAFNTCFGTGTNGTEFPGGKTDYGFGTYTTAVHEIGHALGISRADLRYHGSHPTIPQSVLNYNDELKVIEPDCSPHPFDIMAIHALYQTVK